MMCLDNGSLIITIPNSECRESNSLKEKNLKSSVGEFYISTNKDVIENVKKFLGLNKKKVEVEVILDELKLNVYFDDIEEQIEPYSKLFVDELLHYHKCLEEFYDEDKLKVEKISFMLSAQNIRINSSKYLNMPKKNSVYSNSNKLFYGLLLGEVSNLIVEKRDNVLIAYPKLCDNFNDLIQNHFIKKFNKKRKKENSALPELIMNEPPKNIDSYIIKDLPQKKDNTDYEKRNKNCIALGDLGELLVLEYEKKILGKNYTIESVAKNGLHYDILSYDIEKKCEKHIEVKTTRKNEKEPFYLSRREYDYLCSNDTDCTKCIYRVYFARQKKPKFYIISSEQIKNSVQMKGQGDYIIEPTNYEVSKKNKS